MATALTPPPTADATKPQRARKRARRHSTSLLAHGEPMIWLTGGALAFCLLMIGALLVKVFSSAMNTFWPVPLTQIKTVDGRTYLGELTRSEKFKPTESNLAALTPAARQTADRELAERGHALRNLYRTGNYELTNEHFTWINDYDVVESSAPEWGVVVERLEWGRFYGTPTKFLLDGKEIATTAADAWQKFQEVHAECRARWRQRRHLERHDNGNVNAKQEAARLAVVEAKLDDPSGGPAVAAAEQKFDETKKWADGEFARIRGEIDAINAENKKYQLAFVTSTGVEQKLQVADIVHAYPANQLGFGQKLGVYASRWWEFLTDDPREANSEGGVFPAIWGTVVMTLIMSLAVVPFGVLAALYLCEYAKAGPIVSAIRIAINNLAGVPSIVFGVFGMGFFCYIIGGFIDGGPKKVDVAVWPAPIWFVALAALAACGTGGFSLGLYNLSGRKAELTSRKKIIGRLAVVLWIAACVLFVLVIFKTPFFEGFNRAKLPNPTLGKGGLLWSSLTLALLTLPVVIVATEEALSAVPNSMREGSYACGASKWQTIRRIVLPRAMPGIMTGMILAMARGAGEVAPLMLVGAVKLAPESPVDFFNWGGELGPIPTGPFHPDRSFMHLGFHVFDLGFQSQNSEAAVPMVYTTTMLLILIIAALNVAAVFIRARLRRKFVGNQF